MNLHKLFALSCLILLSTIISAQEENRKQFPLGSFKSYTLGLSNPHYSIKEDNYKFSAEGISYGFKFGIEWGHLYKPGIGFSLAPSLLYSHFSKEEYEYESRSESGMTLFAYREGNRNYHHFSLVIPLGFEVLLKKKIVLGLGGYVMSIISGSGLDKSEGYKYYYYEELLDLYLPYIPPLNVGTDSKFKGLPQAEYAGLYCKVSIPIKIKKEKSNLISLEYYQSLVDDYEYHSIEKWFNLNYVIRLF